MSRVDNNRNEMAVYFGDEVVAIGQAEPAAENGFIRFAVHSCERGNTKGRPHEREGGEPRRTEDPRRDREPCGGTRFRYTPPARSGNQQDWRPRQPGDPGDGPSAVAVRPPVAEARPPLPRVRQRLSLLRVVPRLMQPDPAEPGAPPGAISRQQLAISSSHSVAGAGVIGRWCGGIPTSDKGRRFSENAVMS